MRQVIISVLGLLIILGGYLGKDYMASQERPQPKKEEQAVPVVFTKIVKNTSSPVMVTASGNLAAKERIEIFAEVQGIFEHSAGQFKPGVYYKNSDALIRINSDEHRANLRSQKSNLFNQIVGMLPDLRFDYPESFNKWQQYVNAFEVEQILKPLPTPASDKEKLFVAGRNINTTWYTVKNMEERLSKYSIYAPFSGVLTETNVDKGALIRAGQKLGTFINPGVYELPVSVNSSFANLLKVGNIVSLTNVEKTKTWNGKVNRLNSLIDPNTQTIQAFIRVTGTGLREGMYLEAELTAKNESNTFEISRKLLVDNNKVFVFENGTLNLKEIEPVHFTDRTAIIRGLENGTEILKKSLPGAYNGMQVKKIDG